MSVQCNNCGAVASYGRELSHKLGCQSFFEEYPITWERWHEWQNMRNGSHKERPVRGFPLQDKEAAESVRDFEGADGGPLPELQGRARQFDDAWRAVSASDQMAAVRSRLSIDQLRTLINLVIEAALGEYRRECANTELDELRR